ncbi:putative holin-like toxin [Sporosarcina oncorhynchi]
MVTYDSINMMFQFGMFLAATAATIVALITLSTNRKK